MEAGCRAATGRGGRVTPTEGKPLRRVIVAHLIEETARNAGIL